MKSRLKSYRRKKLGLATVIVFCSLCFLFGFYGSTLLSQNVPRVKPRLRMLDMVENGEEEASSMPHGVTGEESIGSIPFQVLSWRPRAIYFPNFATAEQCQAIIERAKVNLKPSALALRKGETAENTKGTRTRSFFLSSFMFRTFISSLSVFAWCVVVIQLRNFYQCFRREYWCSGFC
jgi:prolyl 4-hydroxylase